jgi:hypothetical protein
MGCKLSGSVTPTKIFNYIAEEKVYVVPLALFTCIILHNSTLKKTENFRITRAETFVGF